MKNAWVAIAVTTLALGTGLHASQARSEEWSLQKINPFGKREPARKVRQDRQSGWLPPLAVPRPLTPTGVKENLTKIGQSTRSAVKTTTNAVAPKNLVPRFHMPHLSLTSHRADAAKPAGGKHSSPISLTEWLSPGDDEVVIKDKPTANAWFDSDPPRP